MAKKSATNKKSSKSQPAAKKATAKASTSGSGKTAGKPAGSTTITEADWAQVYAKAWLDDGFRTLLETDPTAALKQYAKEHGLAWTKLVQVPQVGAPAAGDPDENCIHLVSCC
jgi:hypothetical protein